MAKALRNLKLYPTVERFQWSFKTLRNSYFRSIKIAKTDCQNTFLEKAQGKDVFKALQYTKKKSTRQIPPLSFQGEMREDFEEQCEALIETLFPPLPSTDPPNWESYQAKNWEFLALEEVEVKTAIFKGKKTAPGPDQMQFIVLQKAYQLAPVKIIFCKIYSILLQVRYYPKIQREAIGVALAKFHKDDYSLPKSYRIISLLNCLGKVLERIITYRLGYLASTRLLLDESQIV